jgi:hypothetical protein
VRPSDDLFVARDDFIRRYLRPAQTRIGIRGRRVWLTNIVGASNRITASMTFSEMAAAGTGSTCPCFSMKMWPDPFTMISEISTSRIRCAIGRKNGNMTSKLLFTPSRAARNRWCSNRENRVLGSNSTGAEGSARHKPAQCFEHSSTLRKPLVKNPISLHDLGQPAVQTGRSEWDVLRGWLQTKRWLGNEPKFSAGERNLDYALLLLR